MSTTETNLHFEKPVNPPSPEDHYRLTGIIPDVLGRSAVLHSDFNLGRIIAADATYENAALRREQEEQQPGFVRIYSHPSLHTTKEERQHVEEWANLAASSSSEGRFLLPEGVMKTELADVRARLNGTELQRHSSEIDELLDSIASPFLKNLVDEDDKWLNYARSTEVVNGFSPGTYENLELDELLKKQIKIPKLLEDNVEAMFADTSNETEGKWLKWLTRTSENPTEQAEYDSQLLNFLQHHFNRIEKLQKHPAFAEAIQSQRDTYLQSLQQAEADKWIVEGSAEDAAHDLEEHIKHYVTDEFSAMELTAAAYARRGEHTAYHPYGSTEFSVDSLVQSIHDSAHHEFNHVVLGSLPGRWLDEAVTEHIAEVFAVEWREVTTMAPDTPDDTYAAERSLLDCVIYKSRQIALEEGKKHDSELSMLEASDFTLAYSEAPTDKVEFQDILSAKVQYIFGFDVLGAITHQIQDFEQTLKYSKDGENLSTRQLQERAIESVRHILLQQPEKLRTNYERHLNVKEQFAS